MNFWGQNDLNFFDDKKKYIITDPQKIIFCNVFC